MLVSALDVQQEINGTCKVDLDGLVRKIDIRLKHAAHESRGCVVGGISVNGRERPGMTCVEGLKEIKSFPTPNLADDDAIGAVAKGGLEQIPNGDRRRVRLWSPGFKTDQVALANSNLGRLLNDDNSFLIGNEIRKDVQ